MSRKRGTKGKQSPTKPVVYEELHCLESQTPEEMLKQLGGVAAHATSESKIPIAPPLTPHGGGVPDPTGGATHITPTATSAGHHQAVPTPDWHEQAHQEEQAAKTAESEKHYHQAAQDWDAAGTIYDKHEAYGSAATDYQNSAKDYGTAGDKAGEAQEYNSAGHALNQSGHHNEAGAAFGQAGQAFSDAGHYNEAAKAYGNAVTSYDNVVWGGDKSAEAWENIGQAYNGQGDALQNAGHHNQALTAFNNALTNFNNIAEPTGEQLVDKALAYTGQGEAYQSLGHPQEAITAFNAAVKDFHTASNEEGSASSQLLMGLAQAHLGIGTAMHSMGDDSSKTQQELIWAVDGFEKAFEADKSPTAQQWQDRGDAYAALAHSFMLDSDGQNGQQAVNDAQRAFRDAAVAYDHAADNFRDAGADNLAAQLFNKGGQGYSQIGDNSHAASCYNAAGQEFSKAGQPNEAGLAFENAAQHYGQDGHHNEAALAFQNAAQAYDLAGHQNESQAASDMSKGEESLANHHPNAAAQDFNNAGNAFNRGGHPGEAAQAFQNAGQAFEMAGHYNQAATAYGNEVAAYNDVVNGGDSSDKALANLAQAYTSQGDAFQRAGHHHEALTAFNNALDNFGYLNHATNEENLEQAQAFSGRGQALQSLGRYGDAVEAFQNAIGELQEIGGSNPSSQLLMALAQAHNGLGLAMQSSGDAASKVERQFGLSVENFQKAFDTDKTPTAQQWQDRADAYASLEKYLPAGSSDFNRAVKDALECYHHAAQDDLAVGNYKDAGAAYLGASHVYQTANDNKEASKLAKEAGGYFIDAATKQDLSNSNNGKNDLKDAYNAFKSAASLETESDASATWAAAKSQLTKAAELFGSTTPQDTEREKLASQLASQCPPTS